LQDLIDRLAIALVRGIVRLRLALSPTRAERLARILGWLWYRVFRLRRQVAERNVHRVFHGERNPAEMAGIVMESFRHWCRLAFDLAPLFKEAREDYLRGLEVQGLEHLKKARDRGQGLILISSHYGGFPILSAAFPALELPFYWLSRRPKNRHTRRLFDEWLSRTGCHIIEDVPRHLAGVNCLKVLSGGGCVCFLIDHHFRTGAEVPFFGYPARTAVGPALLAFRSQTSMLPVVMRRLPDGRYRLIIEEAIAAPADSSRENLLATLTELNRKIEGWIRQDPSQWFWIHRRWKELDAADISKPKEPALAE
jgi:KDO2-lipid IV(A) lauroyltransferase